MRGLVLLALMAIAGISDAAVPTHLVTKLPGWDKPLLSKMYSGILPAGDSCTDEGCFQMQEHYVYIESERDPAKDPVLLWTNGGPGAASLFGLFVELGPYQLSDDSLATAAYNKTSIPTLFRNPYAWTSFASVLVINSPPPVGFSYCLPAGPSGNGTSCGAWNDTRTSYHNLEFLKSFFKSYPETRTRDFYLSGESYAGIYVPTLAKEILQYNEVSTKAAQINLKGFAVGDACVGSEVNCGAEGPLSTIEFFRGHGQFSGKTNALIHSSCTPDELVAASGHSAKCNAALDRMADEVGGYFEYSLYDECWGENDLVTSGEDHNEKSKPQRQQGEGSWKRFRQQASEARTKVGAWTPGYPCGGDGALMEWSALKEVRAALHVPAVSNFFSGDNGEGFVYTPTEKSLLPFYRSVITGAEAGKLRVLVYVGDADPSVNSFDAERWTTSLGFTEKEAWRPWTLDGGERMGGYVTRYENEFDFLTIRGAGHMVPQYKPAAAYTAIASWLGGATWPSYTKLSRQSYTKPSQAQPAETSKVASVRGKRDKRVSEVVVE